MTTSAAGDRLSGTAGSRLWSETTLVRASIGLVALHVADDSFFQPQPGTSAGDHLERPRALAVPRACGLGVSPVRAGFRAVVALILGGFGIVVGIEAVYYTTKGGPTGDDFTGLLAIPAGAVLIGIGLVTLWRSRRTDDSLLRRYLRRFLIAVGVIAAVYVVVAPLYASYVFTHVARVRAPRGTRRRPRGCLVHHG